MIASLFGEVISKSFNQAVIDVHGVGYGIYISTIEFEELKINQKYRLYIYESIREDAHDLYGFINENSKQLYLLAQQLVVQRLSYLPL